MKKISLLLSLLLLYGCSQQNQSPTADNQVLAPIKTIKSTMPEMSIEQPISRNTFNELENAYLDLLLQDRALNNLIEYAKSIHISSISCYDDGNEIPVCVAINKQLEHLDKTQNYSADRIMYRYENQNSNSNVKTIVLQEAESLLHKFQESK